MTQWRLLCSDQVDAARGLAVDEALMAGHARGAEQQQPALRLYTYRDHTALCGRYQNLRSEIDIDACARTGTTFNRRPTGGGAIVMGAGQLGVAVVTRAPATQHPKGLLEELSHGIVSGLAKLGVEAEFAGKNDLKVDGRKIAGLGLYLDGEGGLLFHSSVLADLDIGFMLEVLDTPASKLGQAGVEAVGQRITTVSRETGERWDGERLREVVALGFSEALGIDLVDSELTDGRTPAHQRVRHHEVRDRYVAFPAQSPLRCHRERCAEDPARAVAALPLDEQRRHQERAVHRRSQRDP